MKLRRFGRTLEVACVAVLVASPRYSVGAQSELGNAESMPPWVWRWSPLRDIADRGAPGPRAPQSLSLLNAPGTRTGLLWTQGNPAGLPDEIDTGWTRFAAYAGFASGGYHRPLDASNGTTAGTTVGGWGRTGARAAAAGRITIQQESLAGTNATFATPLAASPFQTADTSHPATRRPGITLEGAEGLALGAWRLGIAAGYRAVENTAVRSATALIGRSSTTGVTLGLARTFADGSRAGLYGRYLQGSESVNLIANPQTVRVYGLSGYLSIDPQDFTAAQPPFQRREDRRGDALGVGMVKCVFGMKLTAFAEGQTLDERQTSAVLAPNPPTDRWLARQYIVGAALQRSTTHLLATITADWTNYGGHADRATGDSQTFQSSADGLWVVAEMQYVWPDSSWRGAASLTMGRDRQNAHDMLARSSTDIDARMPSAVLAVSRRFGSHWDVAAEYGMSRYFPIASLPSPQGRGNGYAALIAPALELSAAPAQVQLGSATARWENSRGGVSMRVWRRVARATSPADASIPLPQGEADRWGVSAAFEPRP